MDYLSHVYKSKMRLYRDRPDVLTAGRWYWCPEGAKAIPFMDRFVSMKWDSDGIALDPNQLGEVEVIPGYTSGVANARLTGQRFCGARDIWENGALYAQRGTPATDVDGVPFCCQEGGALGGLAIEGQGGFVDLNSAAWWLNPLSLSDLADGDPISVWPDSSTVNPTDAFGGGAFTVKGTDPDLGLPFASCHPGGGFGRLLNLNLGNEFTIYAVARAGVLGDGKAGPWVIGGSLGSQRGLRVIDAAVQFSSASYAFSYAFAQARVGLHIYSVRASATVAQLAVDGAWLASNTPGPNANVFVAGFSTAVITLPQTRWLDWFELLVFGETLDDDSNFSVLSYLAQKYGLVLGSNEVDTGTIIAFAGAVAPPGYLACDGSAVSRAIYGALFTVLGTTWGPGDGSTTFNLPDLRGRVGIGTGTGSGLTPRTLAGTGGEEGHTLDLSEIPSHAHNFNLNMDTLVGSNSSEIQMGTSLYGGIYSGATDNAGGGLVHNNMQPFAVVQYLVKT